MHLCLNPKSNVTKMIIILNLLIICHSGLSVLVPFWLVIAACPQSFFGKKIPDKRE
jgi:hypothetical protein